jgi:6-phosphofructo-2-kinase / fructose-2,6-biphosphatase 2
MGASSFSKADMSVKGDMAVKADMTFKADMAHVPNGDYLSPSRKTNALGIQADDTKICVVMVGLPARGKSYIAQKC